VAELLDAASAVLGPDDVARLRRATASDAAAWAQRYARATDVSGLWSERNVLRHLPCPVTVRASQAASLADVVRVLAAAALAGAPVALSTGVELTGALGGAAARLCRGFTTVDDATWIQGAADLPAGRLRLVDAPGAPLAARLAAATGGRPDLAVWAGPVTESGRIELQPFLREQAVSITAHRFGTPSTLTAGLLPDAPVAEPSWSQPR
jgi:RHH-type proline utilization regulon transcriptional repressor/proline dehydrogenase/delta 1-pyrroline-5-carboxylate dehydrogenase